MKILSSSVMVVCGVALWAGCSSARAGAHDGGIVDAAATDADVGNPADARVADASGSAPDANESGFYPAEYCAYFLTGEVDLVGTDADGDGVTNGWDHCPNNPSDWLDSDRDGVGNLSDPDMDGDGIANDADPDRDGDGATDVDELAAGTDPIDPSSIPGLPRFEVDLGVKSPTPGWYKGDLHIHSTASHDSEEAVANYVGVATRAGLDFLWITDHRVFEAPFDPGWDQDELLFVPAIEWGGGGHANIGGIRTDMTANYDDVDDVRRSWRLARLQGGVQSLNHYGKDIDHWQRQFTEAPDLLDAIDVMEVWNSLAPFNAGTNDGSRAFWQELLSAGYRIGAVGGSDAHSSLLTVGFPTTVVWAESLSVPGILDGIRRGRTYVVQSEPAFVDLAFSWEGRAELDFRADADGDGVFEAMLGDEVAPGPLTLQVNVRKAQGPVVVIRNGEQLAVFDGHAAGDDITETVTDDAPAGAWYRVEMRQSAFPGATMLLLSSPIYVGD